jgi:hypothetical protein
MRFLMLTNVATFAATMLFWSGAADAQKYVGHRQSRSGAGQQANASENDLARSRSDVIQKLKETRTGAEKLLALSEAERQRLLKEYQSHSELYHRGLIARNELLRVEDALAEAARRVDEVKRRLAETEMAITESSMRDELLRLPRLAIGGYAETNTLLRFNGGAPWTLRQVGRLERFFVETFGRALPISAFGQTATHSRLRFDHRDAIDVALHPDSNEGQSLLYFLRQAGIPFLAFRDAAPGSSTGAHIHVGKPSPRL